MREKLRIPNTVFGFDSEEDALEEVRMSWVTERTIACLVLLWYHNRKTRGRITKLTRLQGWGPRIESMESPRKVNGIVGAGMIRGIPSKSGIWDEDQ